MAPESLESEHNAGETARQNNLNNALAEPAALNEHGLIQLAGARTPLRGPMEGHLVFSALLQRSCASSVKDRPTRFLDLVTANHPPRDKLNPSHEDFNELWI